MFDQLFCPYQNKAVVVDLDTKQLSVVHIRDGYIIDNYFSMRKPRPIEWQMIQQAMRILEIERPSRQMLDLREHPYLRSKIKRTCTRIQCTGKGENVIAELHTKQLCLFHFCVGLNHENDFEMVKPTPAVWGLAEQAMDEKYEMYLVELGKNLGGKVDVYFDRFHPGARPVNELRRSNVDAERRSLTLQEHLNRIFSYGELTASDQYYNYLPTPHEQPRTPDQSATIERRLREYLDHVIATERRSKRSAFGHPAREYLDRVVAAEYSKPAIQRLNSALVAVHGCPKTPDQLATLDESYVSDLDLSETAASVPEEDESDVYSPVSTEPDTRSPIQRDDGEWDWVSDSAQDASRCTCSSSDSSDESYIEIGDVHVDCHIGM